MMQNKNNTKSTKPTKATKPAKPSTVNGKGDKCRVKDWDKFRTNWDKIFKKTRSKK